MQDENAPTTDALNLTAPPREIDRKRIDEFTISTDLAHGRFFIVEGDAVLRFAQMTNWGYYESLLRFQKVLELSGNSWGMIAGLDNPLYLEIAWTIVLCGNHSPIQGYFDTILVVSYTLCKMMQYTEHIFTCGGLSLAGMVSMMNAHVWELLLCRHQQSSKKQRNKRGWYSRFRRPGAGVVRRSDWGCNLW